MVQIKLEDVKVEQIFLDEFSVSSKYNKHKGWSKIGEKGFVKLNYDSFSMFFIVAFSEEEFYGIQGKTNAMNSEDFIVSSKILEETETRNGALFEIMQASMWVDKLMNGREIVELLLSW